MKSQLLRTFLRTNPVTGRLVRWGWRHYLTALAAARPTDCAGIPRVPEAGQIFQGVIDVDRTYPPYQLMHNGIKVGLDGYYSNLFTEVIRVLKGHHEPQEERVFAEVLPTLPDDLCMIEAGGYWAYYSMWAQKAHPRARNIIIEPVDSHMDLGKSNVALNGMSAEFLRAYVGETSHGPQTVSLDGVRVPDVERVCVDDVMDRFRVAFAHVIHGDVQGAELDLLRGAERAIAQARVGWFFLSTHGGGLHRDCRRFLTDRGFVIVAEHTRAESFTTDGLIVARARDFPGPDHIPVSRATSGNTMSGLVNRLLNRV
jgi:FkbM family methyltransferase